MTTPLRSVINFLRMTWTLIDSGKLGDQPLDLYQRDGEFMIRVDGFELMNSFCHKSEQLLANVGLPLIRGRQNAHIVIGGLGLGYTLAAFVSQLQRDSESDLNGQPHITVIEKSADVIQWHKTHFRAKAHKDTTRRSSPVTTEMLMSRTPSVSIVEKDVVQAIRDAHHTIDLLVLDVDNGPEPICAGDNGNLYTLAGLEMIANALTPDGVLLLWSAFVSEEFAERAEQAGFCVSSQLVHVPKMRRDHVIYICQMPTGTA